MAKHNYTDGDSLFQMDTVKAKGPVECLGLTFPDDIVRREHFLGILREKLKQEFKTKAAPEQAFLNEVHMLCVMNA